LTTKHSVDLFIQKNERMKKNWVRFFLVSAGFISLTATAQIKEEKVIVVEEARPAKKEMRQVIITNHSDKKEKMVIEINGDKVTVNGKPIEEMDKKDGGVNVKIRKVKDLEALTAEGMPGGLTFFGDDGKKVIMRGMGNGVNENKPMLGVTTETSDKGGVEIKDVTKESAAEKIGLKKGDIITKIGDDKIENPDDLSEAVQKHKPGEKVDIKYTRDGKEQKATAELGKWKGATAFGSRAPFENFNFDFKTDDIKIDKMLTMPRAFNGQGFSWSGNGPRLGISVQDTDDGKGVKVIEVDEESNAAKAGIKEEDVITHIDDKAVNGVDEISKLLREKKENPTVRFQLTRNGKPQNIEVKMPGKIKTADL
jgi:serine protease Do